MVDRLIYYQLAYYQHAYYQHAIIRAHYQHAHYQHAYYLLPTCTYMNRYYSGHAYGIILLRVSRAHTCTSILRDTSRTWCGVHILYGGQRFALQFERFAFRTSNDLHFALCWKIKTETNCKHLRLGFVTWSCAGKLLNQQLRK